jgi:hypothetical protein
LFCQKKADEGPPLAQSFPRVGEEGGEVSLGWWRGSYTIAAPASLFPVFPINTGEESERKKKNEGRRRTKERK